MRNKILFVLSIFLILCTLSVSFADDSIGDNYINDENPAEGIVINDLEDTSINFNENDINLEETALEDSSSKNKLSSSKLLDYNDVSISDVRVKKGQNVILSVNYNFSSETSYELEVYNSNDVVIHSSSDIIPAGKGILKINLGRLPQGTYTSYYFDDWGTQVISYIKVVSPIINAKVTVPNYNSYYKSGKKLTIKSVYKSNNKPVSIKLKLVYKKAKSKAKAYYITTNSKGVANVNIPVGIGTYKLTVSSANSSVKLSKVSSTVKVNKYVTYKAGKYKCLLTYNQVLALKKAKANGKDYDVTVKTGKYYTYKKPVYKTVKVKKSKWVYAYRLTSEDWWGEWGSEWETYNPKTPKGYKWCGSIYKSGDGWSKTYNKYKKKVYYWVTKKVKTGKYKNAKDPIYMTVSTNSGIGQYGKCDLIEVWSSKYWADHGDYILYKNIKI